MSEKMTKALATAGILIVTIVWGSAFVVMKNSMDVIPPMYLVAYRFTVAAIGLVLIFWKQIRTLTWGDIKYGTILGFFIFLSYLFQTYGLKNTTSSKNAFITTLYVIIVPFLHWVFNKVNPKWNNITAAAIAVIGLGLISLRGDRTVNLGDVLTFICSFGFALHMVLVAHYTICYSPLKLTVVQMVSSSLFAWIAARFLDGPFVPGVFAEPGIVFSILYLGLLSSMMCFLLQNVCQKYISASTSAILFSMESVFGLLFSVIFLNEIVTGRMLIGCTLMFAAAILAEYTPPSKRGKSLQGKETPEAGVSRAELEDTDETADMKA